jgi:hypothetical protein
MDKYEEIYLKREWNTVESFSMKDWSVFMNTYISTLIESKPGINEKIEAIGLFLNSEHEYKTQLTTPLDCQIYENIMDIGLNVLEFYTNQIVEKEGDDSYQYYPELNDPLFNSKIYKKKEFRDYKSQPLTKESFESKPPIKFERTPTQSFVRNYISTQTPYNGVLLWHGVGVGKTCAAIGIVERFKHIVKLNRKKILVITPSETYTGGWVDEIFNLEKQRLHDGIENIQCTGTAYTKIMEKYQNKTPEFIKKKIHRAIHQNYQFIGFQKFANKVKREMRLHSSGKYYPESAAIKYISKEFSNRIIIIDEVHGTRSLGSGKEDDKSIIEVLEKISRYAENTRLILLSATPMYDHVSEIAWLLNLLLLNDKRAPIMSNLLFSSDGRKLLNEEQGLITLQQKSIGYISYLRGEHPKSFPVKIYPTRDILHNDFHSLLYRIENTKMVVRNDEVVDIPDSDKLENITLLQNRMSDYQYNNYKTILAAEKDTFTVTSFMASNIVFPNRLGGTLEGLIGDTGFNANFIKLSKIERYKYKPRNAIQENGKSFLHIDNIQKFSAKYYNIIRLIRACKGIVFIYSKYLKPGAISLAMALEENGYDKFSLKGTDENMLDGSSGVRKIDYQGKYFDEYEPSKQREFKSAKYIILTGKLNKVKLNEYVKQLRGEGPNKNIRGEHIKIVIGTGVVEQGLSFHRVREVHILDPWHHLNRLEQAVGRALRYKSHLKLDPPDRNVTIFLHISTPPTSSIEYKDKIELNDERVYRKAYIKDKEIAKISHLLKRNAIDCQLNKESNIITVDKLKTIGINPTKLITSQGVEIDDYNIGSTDQDRICDYRECEFKCIEIEEDIDSVPINTDTFTRYFASDLIERITEYIIFLYTISYAYRLEDIVEHVERNRVSDNREHIYISIHEIIRNHQTIYDKHQRPGTLIYRDSYYIYQPSSIKDELLPFYYRKHDIHLSNDRVLIADKESITKSVLKSKSRQQTDQQFSIIDTFKECTSYIKAKYSQDYDKDNKDTYPTLDELIKYYKWMKIEELETTQVLDILTSILVKIIDSDGEMTSLTDDELVIYNFYYNSTIRESCIYWEHELDPSSSLPNIPNLFRIIENDGSQEYYSYVVDSSTFEKVAILTKQKLESKLNYNKLLRATAKSAFNCKIYGYTVLINGKYQFYIVNKLLFKEVLNADGTVQKKSDRMGAACGTATDAKDKPHLILIINNLLGYTPDDDDKKYTMDILRSLNKHNKRTKTKTKPDSRSLCEEIQLLLIHKREIDRTGKNWYFRSYEFFTNNK